MTLAAFREDFDADYSRYISVNELDRTAFIQAREIFDGYKKRGVIISGEFDDMSWTFTDETKNVGLTLISFRNGSRKTAMEWIGCTYQQYIQCVKAYIVFHFGEIGLDSLQGLSRRFNSLSSMSSEEAAESIKYVTHIADLLRLIPGGNERRDAVIDALDENMEACTKSRKEYQRRILADFKAYLRFHDVLADFWLSADKKQKVFYFPLYFWWNLTAVLPLRPTEFLLTPRNCLQSQGGQYLLKIRRTKLKSGREKIGYSIANDYELQEYAIVESLAEELTKYIENTSECHRSEIDQLFVKEPHYAYFNITCQPTNRYYTYNNLSTCLRRFYDEIIIPGGHDITHIHLGDTRHLAMTNLILSGGSPVICRELAGHAHIETSAHYYSNISNLVLCATQEWYRKIKEAPAMIHGSSKYPLTVRKNAVKVSGGRCISEVFADNRIDDCLKVFGDNGHIGDCRYCVYFLPDNPGIMVDICNEQTTKEQVDADSKYLIRMIELARKNIVGAEDIGTALLRLQRSGDNYKNRLLERFSREENG